MTAQVGICGNSSPFGDQVCVLPHGHAGWHGDGSTTTNWTHGTEVTVNRQALAWLLSEASANLSSVHLERCGGYGPDHCCTLDQGRIEAIKQAAGITDEEI